MRAISGEVRKTQWRILGKKEKFHLKIVTSISQGPLPVAACACLHLAVNRRAPVVIADGRPMVCLLATNVYLSGNPK
jgi:hypothetical protein